MLDAIIFDHDGTMAPTMERQFAWFQSWWNHPVNAERTQGKAFPYNDLESFFNMYNAKMGHPEEVQNVYDHLGLDANVADDTHAVWAGYKDFASKNPSRLYDGMADVIEELFFMGGLGGKFSDNKRIRLGVNTSNSWALVSGDLRKNDVLKYFDSYVSKEVLDSFHIKGRGKEIAKPSPIPLAESLNMLNASGDLSLYVGDSLVDCSAGKKIRRFGLRSEENIRTIGVTWGYASVGGGKEKAREILQQGVEIPGCGRAYFDHIVDSPQEIVNIAKHYIEN